MANKSRESALDNSNARRRQSTDLNSRGSLIRRLMRSRDTRSKFVESHVRKGISFQIRSLREREDWSQEELAEAIGSNQNAVYRIENPNYGKQTITTLKKIASAFDVALVVRFVPFSQLLNWVSGTPFIDRGLTPGALSVPSFRAELEAGVLDESGVRALGVTLDTVLRDLNAIDRANLAGRDERRDELMVFLSHSLPRSGHLRDAISNAVTASTTTLADFINTRPSAEVVPSPGLGPLGGQPAEQVIAIDELRWLPVQQKPPMREQGILAGQQP